MNDCYLNFLVSFRALFSLDVGANLVNSKQTIGIILPDLSLLGYAVPVESFGIGLFVIGRVNGNASGSSIENCYTSGDINAIGGGNAGGIVGKVDGGKLVIKKCIAWNSMLVSTDKAKVGRIVGGTANATYENCYAYDGMILKAGEATFTVSDETSPSGSSFQGVAKSANELKNTVINWDSSLWKEGGNGYPVFKWSK